MSRADNAEYREARQGLLDLQENPVTFLKLYFVFYISLAKAGKSTAEAVAKAVGEINADSEDGKLVLPDAELALLSQYSLAFQVLMFENFVPLEQRILSAFQAPFSMFCETMVEDLKLPELTNDTMRELGDDVKAGAKAALRGCIGTS